MDAQSWMPNNGCQKMDAKQWMPTNGCVDIDKCVFRTHYFSNKKSS